MLNRRSGALGARQKSRWASGPFERAVEALIVDVVLQDPETHQAGRPEIGVVEAHRPKPSNQVLDRLLKRDDGLMMRRERAIKPEIDLVGAAVDRS